PPLRARAQARALCRSVRAPRAGRRVRQPRARELADGAPARGVPRPRRRTRGSLEPAARRGDAAAMAARDRVRRGRVLLEVAGAGAARRGQALIVTLATAATTRPSTSNAPARRVWTNAIAANHSGQTGKWGGGRSGRGASKAFHVRTSTGNAPNASRAGQGSARATTHATTV